MSPLRLLLPLLALVACDAGGILIDDEGFPVTADDGSPDDTATNDTGDDRGDDTGNGGGDDTGNGGGDDTGNGGGDDTGNGGGDDTGNGGGDDTGDSGITPSDCGPYNPPQGGQIGNPIYRITGEAELVGTGFNSFEWEGCEVARYFNAAGELECETVYEVFGEGEGTFNGFIYEVDIEVVASETSCANQSDVTRFYRVNPGFGTLSLERSRNGQNGWTDFGEHDFTNAQGAFIFDYESPFFRR